MELIKKPIRTYRTIEVKETEELVENSIIVPDSKPDVKSILMSDAECFVSGIEKSGRMVEVSGETRFRILYISDMPDNRIESITARFPWSVSCQKPKTDTEIGVTARCRCQHNDVNVVNGRKIVTRTVMSLVCTFYEIRSSDLAREIEGNNIFVKNMPVNIVALKDNTGAVQKVSRNLALPHGSPPIKEILFSRVNLGNPEISYKDNESAIESKGTLHLLYRGDLAEDSVESVVLEFPVKVGTGVEAGTDNIVFSSANLKGWDVEAAEDSDGINTQVSVSMDVEVNSQAMKHEEQVIVEDAYSLDTVINLNKAPVDMIVDERELCESHEASSRVRLETAGGGADEVYMVTASNKSASANMGDRAINVQGNVGVDVLYCANKAERDNRCQSLEIPFSKAFLLPDDGMWQIVDSDFFIDDVGFDIIGNDSVDVAVKISIRLRLRKTEQVDVIESMEAVRDEAPARRAPIMLYFTQPGDSLWSIAKRYRIPLSKLAQDNNLDAQARLDAGKKMFIMA
jgi:hypothetical protein